ncbi:cellulose synthase/poly-beta-1,6-N-acetylglucosamine synthase-like glycosyltransferase [Allocatelliglobosispora scoriae]|uniref:Cellulose synthase/poly-beta-1,6-N-acetylglucosamine synthase-like glycosyltransferase n=1 Tax=Allocatelliglobosispora scoriae TaxID=643052 RepID=A0A841C6B8_9ACTN|nr:glycosyltransferase [Allocatelliglobosispora scoriae]MBB5874632.1 cellulose synthase/poly-beta-1,6-N-acetylglucosamine synthase-like glycosyltransferase [Allocatelliglobosispora scoriae]
MIATQDNDFRLRVAGTENMPLSVVVPIRNRAFVINRVLDAIAASKSVDLEVIVVDDASDDDGAFRAAAHPCSPTVVRLAKPIGSSVARNVGTILASAQTVAYVDGDMLLPPLTLHELAARAADDLVLLGFRQHVPAAAIDAGPLTPTSVDLDQDPRVSTIFPVGILPFSGAILDGPEYCRLLEETDDLRTLGHGRWILDWALPRTVITALVAMPRDAVIDVGGFHPGFHGLWGAEDAYVGAKLIAAGCKVAPVRSAVGLHVDPPEAQPENGKKQSSLPRTVAFYRSLLAQPMPVGGDTWLREHARAHLDQATVIRGDRALIRSVS